MATSSDVSDQIQNVKSKRPAESAFKQQRLPAWQPILTAGTVLPTFFVIGIAFIPVGIGLLYFSDEVSITFIPHINSLSVTSLELSKDVPVFRTGIAWTSDKEIKFRNPPGDLKTGMNDVHKQFRTGIAWTSDKEIKFRNPPGDLKTGMNDVQ
ncbi:putative cell cycle control protein [Operophtera brumata]|uniref:Putative cell cycle control protein n=1 Tax=Operophtera brumata TaxID=104452 RepID=A0A0L7KT70_OPEBR|nr:putative cell cycle control protein [Operophtera brumata]